MFLTSLEPLWASVGETLLHLEIVSDEYNAMVSLKSLFALCAKESHVSLDFKGILVFKAMLKNGFELRKLSFEPVDSQSAQTFCTIVAAHGSAVQSLSVSNLHSSEHVVRSIAEQGRNLRELSMSWTNALASLAPLRNLLSRCPAFCASRCRCMDRRDLKPLKPFVSLSDRS